MIEESRLRGGEGVYAYMCARWEEGGGGGGRGDKATESSKYLMLVA